MGEPTDEAAQPEMARLICTVPMQRRPSIFEVAREAELFPLPARDRLTVPFTEMGDQPECFPWTKARHTRCKKELADYAGSVPSSPCEVRPRASGCPLPPPA